MSVKIVQERLDSYSPASIQEEENALKEILQEIALAAMARTDFFKSAVFQGGTCLRILHSLDRFSEDLDFILKKPDPRFEWSPYLKDLETEFEAYGLSFTVEDRSEEKDSVKKIFLKEDSIGQFLVLKNRSSNFKNRKIKIKFELDTNPPEGSGHEIRYLDFPFPFAVTVQDAPSLFAGKSHALLCREYVKGRDWYDFLWYVGRKTRVNFQFLFSACDQLGPWKGNKIQITKEWYLNELERKIKSMNWKDASKDVSRFLKPNQQKSLELWSEEFFLDRLKKLASYL